LSSTRDLLLRGAARLADLTGIDPGLEARLLLKTASGWSSQEILTSLERPVPSSAERRFLDLVEKRRDRAPLAYLIGEREFWSLPFRVTHNVLIPRPETELLVEKVLERTPPANSLILDIGTGSGNIALALARELPDVGIIAVDISRAALKAARFNAERLGLTSVMFVYGDLFRPLERTVRPGTVDAVVSNPPYVAAGEWRTLEPEVRDHEPKRALVAGPTGLEVIRRLVRGALPFLKRGGILAFEIGSGQSADTRGLMGTGWRDVRVFDDLQAIPRVVVAEKA
jgi:release factor glutamine methyltransferase